MKLEICIPAFDELSNLSDLLPRINEVASTTPSLEILVKVILRCNEPESSLDEMRKLSAIPLRRQPNNNFASALNTAIRSIDSDTDWVLFMDADGSHNPIRIPNMIRAMINSRADIVVASRYIEGGQTDNPPILIFLSRILNYAFALVMGIQCKDISTNFKLYRASLIRNINLECHNFDAVEELLLIVNQRVSSGAKILEVPDHFEERKSGKSKRRLGLFVATYIVTLVKLRIRLRHEHRRVRR